MRHSNFMLKLKKNGPTILTIIGIAGMWVTTALVYKSAPAVKEKVKEKEEALRKETKNKEAKLTVVEKAKVILPTMWPTLAIGGLSTACIISAHRLNLRQNAALASALYLTRGTLKEYQERVVEAIGEKKNQKIKDEIAKEHVDNDPITSSNSVIVTGEGDHLCYDMVFGTYFYSTIEKVRQAVLNIDEKLINEMYMTVNDFRYELGLPAIDLGENMGWNIENGQMGVEFSSQLASNGRPCLVIRYDVVPV